MPTGLLFPAIFTKQKKWFYFLISFTSILIGIEIMQLVFRLGKFDIDDFILNMAGACLVYGILRIGVIKRFLNRTRIII
jgi:glycopeptide antibiotics resistance protein